jgi:hypothetical protein
MTPLGLNGNQPVHKLRCCNKCDEVKPPEGGIDMGHKWICQSCWIAKKIGRHQRSTNDQRRSN